jgi:hypothetical protein
VTDPRAKVDCVAFPRDLLTHVSHRAHRVHCVLDNRKTHFRTCVVDVLGIRAARALLRRVAFPYTPKHASWRTMAESEIGILDRQCLRRRLPHRAPLGAEVAAWQRRRYTERRTSAWTFTRPDADRKRHRHYVA